MTTEQEHSRATNYSWPGYFVVLEGIDGTGKSTLARALGEAIQAKGIEAVVSFEPTRGPHGLEIRRLATEGREGVSAEEEIALFVADRKEHLRDLVLPSLEAGKVVILDRYYYSTMAYQGAKGADPAAIEREHRSFAPEPDLLIILELDVPTALERVQASRGDEPDHFEGKDYLGKVAEIFDTVRHPNLLRLDARRPTSDSVQSILGAMEAWIDERYPDNR